MKRYLRRVLPHPDSLRNKRWFRFFGSTLLQPALWHLNRRTAPAAVAIGMLCGLIPGPFQMLGAALLCLYCRANLPLALATTLYTNPVTILPLYLLAFRIGAWIMGSQTLFVAPPELHFAQPLLALQAWAAWLLSLGKPLIIGLPILAGGLAITSYAVLRLAWRIYLVREWKRRKMKRTC